MINIQLLAKVPSVLLAVSCESDKWIVYTSNNTNRKNDPFWQNGLTIVVLFGYVI